MTHASHGAQRCHECIGVLGLAHADADVAGELLLGVVPHHDARLRQAVLDRLGVTALQTAAAAALDQLHNCLPFLVTG